RGKILACDTPQRLKTKVTGGATWKIEITPNLSELESVKSIPGVVGLSTTDNIESGVTTLKLVLEDESVMSDLLSKIRENGSRVLKMGKSEPSLEDAYSRLAGTAMRYR